MLADPFRKVMIAQSTGRPRPTDYGSPLAYGVINAKVRRSPDHTKDSGYGLKWLPQKKRSPLAGPLPGAVDPPPPALPD
jgi:hypothetical protein